MFKLHFFHITSVDTVVFTHKIDENMQYCLTENGREENMGK